MNYFGMPKQTEQLTYEAPGFADSGALLFCMKWVLAAFVCCHAGISNGSGIESEAHDPMWAFQAVQDPEAPAVQDQEWPQQPLDYFILSRLEAAGMQPAKKADRRTLIRRLSFDLLGLPPDPADVEAYVNNPDEDAYLQYVEKFLASPAFGERWGRHWLDVARYADSKGYVFQEERKYPFAYTFRDYVVRAFNEDLPINQFLMEQIAADQLANENRPQSLAALGYLTLGRRFLNNQHDIIDDRIDVVTRGMMGLTVACARCHDHKYDPIPIDDYYALYGVFSSSYEPGELPLLDKEPPQTAAYQEYVAEKERRIQARVDFLASKEAETRAMLRSRAGEFLEAAMEARPLGGSEREDLARKRQMDPTLLNRWVDLLDQRFRLEDRVFGPLKALQILESGTLAEKQALLIDGGLSRKFEAEWNSIVLERLGWITEATATDKESETRPESLATAFTRFGEALKSVDEEWIRGVAEGGNGAGQLTNANAEELRWLLYGSGAPFDVSQGHLLGRVFDVAAQQEARRLQREIDSLAATHEGAPARGMALYDKSDPGNARVFLRGNPRTPGNEAPRRFLTALSGENPIPLDQGSGRLQLARAVASNDNPLTARVFVNRVWLHLFGKAIVRTPSDFGTRSDPPTHPDLLDHLATTFMESGWSTKQLIRQIVTSSAYQQSSHGRSEEYFEKDPDNFLVWKMNRKRLELEPMRDSILQVSGALDPSMGGRPVEITEGPFTYKRTLYGFIDRQNLPNIFRAFDFANPDSTCPERFTTTAPQQTLYLMNHPFVIHLSKLLAGRALDTPGLATEEKIQFLYRRLFQRKPTSMEIETGQEFLSSYQSEAPTFLFGPTWSYGYGTWNPDMESGTQFTPFPHYTGNAWQGSGKLPDPELGWATLNAQGGHPGENPDFMVIRRWQAPAGSGTVSIRSRISHASDQGDGVRARIVSSGSGLLGEWLVKNSSEDAILDDIQALPGEYIDFIVDCRSGPGWDSFNWAPRVVWDGTDTEGGKMTFRSNASREFSGPAAPDSKDTLTSMEAYAQALILSNEFTFID